MQNNEKLEFTRALLRNMGVPCSYVTGSDEGLGRDVDRGLRSMIFGRENYSDILFNSLTQAERGTVYRFFDEHHCCYIFLKMPVGEEYFFIGPYLLYMPNPSEIGRKLAADENACVTVEELMRYYTALPLIGDENLLLTIGGTLAEALYGKNAYRMEYIEYMIPDRVAPSVFSAQHRQSQESSTSIAVLEARYASEKELMEAVSQGQLHRVSTIAAGFYLSATEQRLSDGLRNRKNYMIILNTLLRKAAEYGKVHPVHIDRMSARYAMEIEQLSGEGEAVGLMEDMIRSYCLLVKEHSLRNHSDLVGRAIAIIHFDLPADLSLKSIAAQLNVTPAYLSALFKKECGCTLTEYVNDRRLDYALHLLTNTNRQIQNVAFECGVQDVNYFIRLFKRRTGMTPTQYRKHLGKL